MTSWYFHHFLLLCIAGVALFALWKGGWPERFGAGSNLLVALLVFILQRWVPAGDLGLGMLVLDGFLGLIFLGLAIRFTSLWLGGAMLLQAVQFSLHAFYYVTGREFDLLFKVVNNLVSWGVLAVILAGVVVTWRGIGRREI